ncbi:MAG TPA: hypothetical protein VMS23_01600 [Terrimicrobiaceae bacterium]|nr:hypothetical protein [Terrimicrobiaceae bacterium]
MRRCRKLVACCSTTISLILLFAGSLTVVEPGAMRTTRSVAHQLSIVLDPTTGKDFKSFIRQALSQYRDTANVKKGLETRSITAAFIPRLPSDSRSTVSTTSSVPSTDTKSPSKGKSRSDLVWLFDQPGGPPLFAFSRDDQGATVTGFLIDGENASDQPLTDVQAVLIPDRNAGNLELSLGLREQSPDEPVRTIPPGAQFSLANTFSNDLTGSSDTFVEKCGGVIFTFHYTHAGVRKSFPIKTEDGAA